jgi:excisionase family DNA binding protein
MGFSRAQEIDALKSLLQKNRPAYFADVQANTSASIAVNRWCHMIENPTAPRQNLAPAVKLAYRVDEACHALGIGRTSFYELVKSGELKVIRIAGRTLVPRSELERLTSLSAGE